MRVCYPACRGTKKCAEARGKVMIDKALMTRLLCVAVVAAIMLPAGHMLFPYVDHLLSGTAFQAIEAVVSASVGFGISAFLG